MAIDHVLESTSTRTPRRSVLAAALGGAAALVASAIGRPGTTRAAAGQPVLQGQNNTPGALATTVTAAPAGTGAIVGTNSSTTGRGVYGRATAVTGTNYGVYGASASSGGRGVYGAASNASGIGIYGKAPTTAGTGVAVRADGGTNTGLSASTTSASKYAVRATTSSTDPNATAILGLVTSTTPGDYSAAVRGENKGIGLDGIGVWGSQAGAGWGVYGTTVDGTGVFALATGFGDGLRAEAASANGVHAVTHGDSGVSAAVRAEAGILESGVLGGQAAAIIAVNFSQDPDAFAISASASHTAIYAVVPSTDSTSVAVHGESSGTAGVVTGVRGTAVSPEGIGVHGFASNGIGVRAESTGGFGLYVSSATSVAAVIDGHTYANGAIKLGDITEPNTFASGAWLFSRDVAGKSQLCAKVGALVVVLATEP